MRKNTVEKQSGTEITECRTTSSLEHALDIKYRELLQDAKADWQHLFSKSDASDSCVSVRISKPETANELAASPRAGFLPIKAKPIDGNIRRRLA